MTTPVKHSSSPFYRLTRNLSESGKEPGGIPKPVEGFRVVFEPSMFERNPGLQRILDMQEVKPTCSTDDVDDGIQERSSFYSSRRQAWVHIYSEHGVIKHVVERTPAATERMQMVLATAMVGTQAWDYAAEIRAQERLRGMVKPHLFEGYMMTGCLLESSPRSRLHYLIRRGRPTIAMTPRHREGRTYKIESLRFLAALCMHPIGYYYDTWAGSMVPTDEVITFLAHIRGDEHLLWRRAYQHPVYHPQAGL